MQSSCKVPLTLACCARRHTGVRARVPSTRVLWRDEPGEKSMRFARRGRTGTVLVVASVAAYALIWVALPSNDVHPDALDELQALEAGHLPVSPKHPADGPVLSAFFRGLRFLGYAGRAIRPIQIWNGLWMTAALAGVLFFVRRSQARWTPAAGVAAILAGMYASIHLAVDPFLSYYPPGLALVTWALALSLARSGGSDPSDHRGEWRAVSACLVCGELCNPMVAVGCPVAALAWFRRARSAGRSRQIALLRGLAPLVVPVGILFSVLRICTIAGVGGPFGSWNERTLPSTWLTSRSAVLFP